MTFTDEQSRALIVEDLESTILVDAGAGSGKTTSMVNRIMAIILAGRADVQEIVAITFTNEGAASLKNKIRHELETAYGAEVYSLPGARDVRLTDVQRKRIAAALPRLPLAQFSTIHGFCLRLLKERPVEAGVDPAIDMNTDGAAITVFEEAWGAFLVHAATVRAPFLEYSMEHAIDLNDVKTMARIKCENPDLTLYTEDALPPDPREVDRAFEEVKMSAAEMYTHIHLLEGETGSGIGRRRYDNVALLYNATQGRKSRQEKLAFLLGAEVIDDWKQGQRLFSDQATAAKGVVARIQERVLNALHHAIAGYIGEFEKYYAEYKKRASALDFEDLLLLARNLLRDHPDVREYFKRQFRYIFIDEAQDTDHLQTEIVFYLAETPGEHAGAWNDVRLQAGKLFMVGDPKQSIYRFRRADIAMYETSKKLILGQGGKVLTLSKNFRSVPSLIGFINGHFAESFARFERDRESGLQPEYVPLIASIPEGAGHSVGAIPVPLKSNTPGFLEAELRALVALIGDLVGNKGVLIGDPSSGKRRRIRYGDIMILMKAMTDFPAYETAFEDAGIPHFQVGGRTFFLTEDIRGLIFSLKAINDPLDTVSLFGALRSSVFGLSDQDLFEAAVAGKGLRMYMNTEEAPVLVATALSSLRALRARREQLRPSGVLRELLSVSGVSHVVLGERNGIQKAARHFRLLELLLEIEAEGAHTFQSCLSGLEGIMAADDPQLANVMLTPSAENAVKITTIHKAKGLESPVVILAGGRSIEGLGRSAISHIVVRDENWIIIPFRDSGGYYSLDRALLKESEGRKELCEAERLRYVAATRARDLLVICTPTEPWKGAFNGKFSQSLLGDDSVDKVAIPESMHSVRPAKAVKGDAEKLFAESVAKRQKWVEQAGDEIERREPMFVSVHEMMEDPGELFTRGRRRSRGKGFGIVFHRMMEWAVKRPGFDPHQVIDQWMEEEDVPARFRDDLLRGFETISTSAPVVEAQKAKERHCEWEFFRTIDGRVMNGVIDLVYRRAKGGWTIIDYKTDDISDPERRRQLDEYYANQVKLYAESFSSITGEKVEATKIMYVDDPTPG